MNRLYLVIILTIIFLLAILFTTITLRLRYWKQGENDQFTFDLSIWRGLIHYRMAIPVIKVQQPAGEQKKKLQPGFWKHLWPRPAYKIRTEEVKRRGHRLLFNILYLATSETRRYYPTILYLINRVKLRRFNWSTEIGLIEPALTGMLAGTAWGLKGFVSSYFYRLFAPGRVKPVLNVRPNFKTACFNTNLDCIFAVRFGYIIFTSLKALVVTLKQKGG